MSLPAVQADEREVNELFVMKGRFAVPDRMLVAVIAAVNSLGDLPCWCDFDNRL